MDEKRPRRGSAAKSLKVAAASGPTIPEADVQARPEAEVPGSADFAHAVELGDTSAVALSVPHSGEPLHIADAADLEVVDLHPMADEAEHHAAPLGEATVSLTEPTAEAALAPETPSSPRADQQPGSTRPTIIQAQKDMIMDMTSNFGSGLNDVMAGAQDKAKEAFEKSSSMLGEAGSFARGNVEAVVESGKILAAGLQDMSTNLVAEGRSSFETMTADLKELAASKTPADFFKAQGEIMRKSLDSAVAYGSKNSEAMLKLASDVFAPLSGRMNVAAEKVKMPLA